MENREIALYKIIIELQKWMWILQNVNYNNFANIIVLKIKQFQLMLQIAESLQSRWINWNIEITVWTAYVAMISGKLDKRLGREQWPSQGWLNDWMARTTLTASSVTRKFLKQMSIEQVSSKGDLIPQIQ